MKFLFKKFFVLSTFVKRVIRNCSCSLLFGQFGKGSQVFGRVVFYYPGNIYMGCRSTLNEDVILNATAQIKIGDDVHISSGCILNTSSLDLNKQSVERKHTSAPISLADGVWLASGVIVNPGIRIGKNSVIGAGSVVTRDIPDNVIAYGVPAEVRSELFSEEVRKIE